MSGTILYFASVITVFSPTSIASENMIPGLEENICGSSDFLESCLQKLPSMLKDSGRTALPLTVTQIDILCRAYTTGIECVDTWSRECLAAETRKLAEQQTSGARQMMTFLCNDDSFRKEYLNNTICFKAVSIDWNRCFGIFHESVTETIAAGPSMPLYHRKMEMCCARNQFQSCIMKAGRSKCDRDAAILLRRMSETLSADDVYSAKCKTMDIATCAGHQNLIFGINFRPNEMTYFNVALMILFGFWTQFTIIYSFI